MQFSINCDILYNIILFGFITFKAGILNIPGNRYKIKGINNDIIKLIIESFIRWIWVFIYTPQKHVI